MSDPRVIDEAVEAAAKRYWQMNGDDRQWGDLTPVEQDQLRFEAREVVEAAVPLLAPQPAVDREAVKAVLAKRLHGEQVVDLLMDLVRPMPTREQIARAQYDQDVADGNQIPNPWEVAGDIIRGAYLHSADAVLALSGDDGCAK